MKSEMPESVDRPFETGDLNEGEENTRFNGAELSESVLARDWNSPEEETAWSNL
jgi:hypothetical protein